MAVYSQTYFNRSLAKCSISVRKRDVCRIVSWLVLLFVHVANWFRVRIQHHILFHDSYSIALKESLVNVDITGSL